MSWPFRRATASRVFAFATNSGRDGTRLFEAAAGVFIFSSRSLYRSLGRMNADCHRNEGNLFSLYLTFYPRLNCGTHPQFVLMKFSNAVAVGSRLFFPPAWFCLFMQRIRYLIVSGCKISRKQFGNRKSAMPSNSTSCYCAYRYFFELP